MADKNCCRVDLATIAQALLQRDNYVICGHVSPDGDCIGSELALAIALRACGKKVTTLLTGVDPLDRTLKFLPGSETLVPVQEYRGRFDVFISVDVSAPERLGQAAKLHAKAAYTITIDHHICPNPLSTINFIEEHAASTSQLVWELIGLLGCEPTAAMACCALTGLMSDTGCFQFQNADRQAFMSAASMVAAGAQPSIIAQWLYQNRALASLQLEAIMVERLRFYADGAVVIGYLTLDDFQACHAVKADSEPLIDELRSIAGVSVACFLREREHEVRGSLRAKGDTDVAAIAKEFGGGGHRAAAGFSIQGSLDHALEMVSKRLRFAVADTTLSCCAPAASTARRKAVDHEH